jgi:raffinose/stachyose/melibiose transport system substrate-binding protein
MKRSIGLSLMAALLAAACGGTAATAPPTATGTTTTPSPTTGDTGKAVIIEFLSSQPEEVWGASLAEITAEFALTHPGSSFKTTFIPLEQMEQQVALLSAQNALPALYNTGAEQKETMKQLAAKGEVLDLEAAFREQGVLDRLSPVAVDLVKSFYDGNFWGLPLELNIEGIWYNKKLFADNNLQPPTTWDELLAVSESFKAKGIQPLATAGKNGWPATRLIGNYLFRSLGPDAIARAVRGEAKLTDPEYVAGAQAIADLGAKGYFGPAVSDLDYDSAQDLFLQGKAAMFYMGSWALRAFSNPDINKIGEDAIGFVAFPAVAGGTGSVDQIPMNVGTMTAVNAKHFTPEFGEWLALVAKRYAATSFKNQGTITGFLFDSPPAAMPPATRTVVETIEKAKGTVTWFEQALPAEAGRFAGENIVPLITGQLTAAQYMAAIQEALR